MEIFLVSSFRAIRSLFAPGMFSVMIVSVFLTIAVLTGFILITSSTLAVIGAHMAGSFIAGWLPWIGGLGSMLIAWLLFPGIMPIIISFFDTRIVTLIERTEYPTAGATVALPFWDEFWHDVRFSVKALVLNIIVLPLYLFPIVNIFLFYLLNGWLLGREFFVMVAKRHMPLEAAEDLRRTHSRLVTCAGAVLTFLATIPILNLFAPFWGIALMTHIYHLLAKPQEVLAPGQ